MASANLPPRQKMINMMYLVLTAILALNVSKEVLDSFAVLDADLMRSEHAHAQRSQREYAAFDVAAERFPERYGHLREKALAVKQRADSLVDHISRVKAQVIEEAEGKRPDEVLFRDLHGRDSLIALAGVDMKDDREALTRLLVGAEPARPRNDEGSATDIRTRVHGFRDLLKGYCATADPLLAAGLDLLFELPGAKDASGVENNWESLNFHDVPLAAGIAALSKLQADIRSAENDMVKWLYRSASIHDHVVSSMAPAVLSQSTVVMLGDSFRAEVFLAAYDEKVRPHIQRVGTDGPVELPVGPDGKGLLRLRADRVGEQLVQGTIRLQGPNGPEEHPYSVRYQVMAPMLVAAPTKMNVLYRGVENPLELSVPGVPAEAVRPVTDNGAVTRSGEGWVARVNTLGKARLSAHATMPDGSVRTIGPVEFRVKDLPAPQAYLGGAGASDGRIQRAALNAAQGIVCRLGKETDFDAPFKVTRFTVSVIKGGTVIDATVNGNAFDGRARQLIGSLRPGDRLLVAGIKGRLASGQGREYDLAPLSLRVVP